MSDEEKIVVLLDFLIDKINEKKKVEKLEKYKENEEKCKKIIMEKIKKIQKDINDIRVELDSNDGSKYYNEKMTVLTSYLAQKDILEEILEDLME